MMVLRRVLRTRTEFTSFEDLLMAYNEACPPLLRLSRRSLFRRLTDLRALGLRYQAVGYQRRSIRLAFVPRLYKNSKYVLEMLSGKREEGHPAGDEGSAEKKTNQGKQEGPKQPDSKESFAPAWATDPLDIDPIKAARIIVAAYKRELSGGPECGYSVQQVYEAHQRLEPKNPSRRFMTWAEARAEDNLRRKHDHSMRLIREFEATVASGSTRAITAFYHRLQKVWFRRSHPMSRPAYFRLVRAHQELGEYTLSALYDGMSRGNRCPQLAWENFLPEEAA